MCLWITILLWYLDFTLFYLEAVAIPLAMGSFKPSLSITACTKFAPIKPVRTTTAAVSDAFTPIQKERQKELKYEKQN